MQIRSPKFKIQNMFDGILIIDKPPDVTSHDVVSRLRRILKTKRVGHTGTLDPFATGVLVTLIGKATRLARFFDKDAKEYEAVVRLGFETDTGDRTGKLRITNYELRDISVEEIKNVLEDFRGEIEQTPPMYSAKKIKGVKLYELARKKIEIERAPAKVSVYELQITNCELRKGKNDFELKTLDFGLKISCSAGTYVRTLAEEIGKKLGVGAHLAELRRTRAGSFDISKAVSLEKLEEIVSENEIDKVAVSMSEALSHLPEVALSPEKLNKTKNGLKLKFENEEFRENQPVKMVDEANNLIAIGFYDKARRFIQPRIVLI